MQDVRKPLSSAINKAPFIKDHRLHTSEVETRSRWYRDHYADQYTESDPRTTPWLRSLAPRKEGVVQYLKVFFPCIQWLPRYNLPWLVRDLIAGLTVGAVIIPQGMAYARIAELPVEMGLYSSFIGGALYFMFGSSKDINIGPVAIASIVTGNIIDEVQSSLPQESRTEIAGLVALMAGAVVLVISLLRLGWLVNLIALPAIAAFVSGVAITIAGTQLPTLLGIRGVEDSDAPYLVYINTLKKLGETKVDAVTGISALFLLYFLKWFSGRMSTKHTKRAKLWFFVSTTRTVFTILFFILVSYLVNRSRKTDPRFRILGAVPKGFHGTFKPKMSRELFKEILPQLPTIVIVLLIEHLSIAKSFGRLNNYTINPNSEMLAIGVTNVVGPFIGAYAVSGSFSRTAINAKAGAATPLAGVVAAVLVVIAIYLLEPMLYFIPNSVLAAVIMHAILDLITSPSTLYDFWRTSPLDLMIFVIGLTVGIFSSVETGLYVMIALSMAIYLFQIFKTHGHLLGEVRYRTHGLPKSSPALHYPGHEHDEQRYFLPLDKSTGCNPSLDIHSPPPGVFIYRLADAFNYLNAGRALDQLVDQIKQETRPTTMVKITKKGDQPWSVTPINSEDIESAIQLRPTLKAVILDFSAINHLDATSVQALVDTRALLQRYVAPNTIEWHFVRVENRWTRRALASVGFGQPQVSTETGEPRKTGWVFAFARAAPKEDFADTGIWHMNANTSIEPSEKLAAPITAEPDTPASDLTTVATKEEPETPVHPAIRQLNNTYSTALYGINRPYFHPDIPTALENVQFWLQRPHAGDEQ